MSTIAENLITLNETKQAIKTAIEEKGQDLTDVPFTEYADKIRAIQEGGSGLQGVEIEITSNITNASSLRDTLFNGIQSSHIAYAALTKAKNNEVVNNQVISLFAFLGLPAGFGVRIRDGKYTNIDTTISYDVGTTIGDVYMVYDLGETYGN